MIMPLLDYREPTNRLEGFDCFYQAMLETNDVSPDMAVERWIADNQNFDFEKRCSMALFHGLTYDGPSEMVMANKFPLINLVSIRKINAFYLANKTETNNRFRTLPPDSNKRWYIHKARLAFLNSLEKLIEPHGTLGEFIKEFAGSTDPIKNYLSLQKAVAPTEKIDIWQVSKRMGTWCFLEALSRFTDIPIEPPNMWFGPEGLNHTGGWMYAMGRDDLIQKLKDGKKLDWAMKGELDALESAAKQYISDLKEDEPQLKNVGFFTLETCCCNYFKQAVKASHYGLCYIDEQHDVTKIAESLWPDHQWLWDLYWKGRQEVIPSSMLYENYHKTGNAYNKAWRPIFKETGRMIRVEAYMNMEPSPWPEESYSLAHLFDNV